MWQTPPWWDRVMGPVELAARQLLADARHEQSEIGLRATIAYALDYGPEPDESDTAPARRILDDATCTVDRLTARLRALRLVLEDADRGLRALDDQR